MNTEMIWEKFSNKLLLFIKSKTGNQTDSEDLLQEVFLRIHNNLDTLKNLNKLESWIFQITRNVITDYYRKRIKHESFKDEISVFPMDEQNFKKEIVQCITSLIDQLPYKYKQPLKEVYMEGKTQKSVAEEIGLSLPGVKSRIQRGRTKLKVILKNCCNVEALIDPLECNCNC